MTAEAARLKKISCVISELSEFSEYEFGIVFHLHNIRDFRVRTTRDRCLFNAKLHILGEASTTTAEHQHSFVIGTPGTVQPNLCVAKAFRSAVECLSSGLRSRNAILFAGISAVVLLLVVYTRTRLEQ